MAKRLAGADVTPSERFLAGGGTTIRGFAQDKLGPLDSSGAAVGGEAMLVLNSELRFPLYKFIDGVGFVDTGNVYSRLGDFNPFNVRSSYGFGLRIRTPYVVLRLDYGLKISPRPGERRGIFFGSIGQAF
jgi:outer membrane protein insertion porin family